MTYLLNESINHEPVCRIAPVKMRLLITRLALVMPPPPKWINAKIPLFLLLNLDQTITHGDSLTESAQWGRFSEKGKARTCLLFSRNVRYTYHEGATFAPCDQNNSWWECVGR